MREELRCNIHPENSLDNYKYVVICSYYQDKWLLSKHKKRDTWEMQGGHIEEGETPHDTAKRELYEESGVREADLYYICDYEGYDSQSSANGAVFLAVCLKARWRKRDYLRNFRTILHIRMLHRFLPDRRKNI